MLNSDDPQKRKPSLGSVGAVSAAVGTGLYAAGARAQGLTAAQTLSKASQNISSIGRGGVSDATSAITQGAGVAKNYGKDLLKRITSRFRLSDPSGVILLQEEEESRKAKMARYALLSASGVVLGRQGLKAHRIIKSAGGYKDTGGKLLAGVKRGWSGRALSAKLDSIINFEDTEGSGIHIKKENEGKFTATQKKTGKSVTQLLHSKNSKTRARANFARMAKRHWKPIGGSVPGDCAGSTASLSRRLDDIIAFKAIDLGDTPDYGGIASCDSVPSKKYFPTLYVSGRRKPLDIPDEGEATVKYRVRSRSMNKYEGQDEKHSADIEIHSIDPIKGDGGKKGKAKLLKIQPDLASLSSKLDAIINFDNRPRDGMGQYANQESGAPNPNDMAKVYSRAQRTGIAEGAGAATIGGVGAHVGKSAYDALLTKIRSSRGK